MPRLAILSLVVFSSIGLTACSKKQEATPPTPPASDQPATTAEAAPPTPREIDFSGRSSNTGPSDGSPAVESGQSAAPAGTIEVQMPVLVEYYPPFYPLSDRMKGAEARLAIGLIVTETGQVESPVIQSTTMPSYKDEALKAAAQWRFIPALHEGKPIRFPVTIPLSFVSEFGTGEPIFGSPLENLVIVDGTFFTVDSEGRHKPANLDITPLTRVQPVFRPEPGGAELRVVLRFKVNEEGRVLEPLVVESSNTGFDQAALKAIGFWQFLPKIKEGKPVVASAQLPLRISNEPTSSVSRP